MRCFTHQEKEAVAICRACGKGLCPDCGVDLGRGLSCRGRCEQDARDYTDLMDRSVQIHKEGVQSVTIQQSQRTLVPPPDQQLLATVAGHIHWARRFRVSIAVFSLLLAAILVGWASMVPEGNALLLVIGVSLLVFGTFNILQLGNTPDRPQPPSQTQTH